MDNGDLLLTEKKIQEVGNRCLDSLDKPMSPLLLLFAQTIAQAQLDKVLKPEWKDIPDSEGWWWQELYGDMTCFNLLTGNESHIPGYVEFWTPQEGIDKVKIEGKWSKVIMPEIEEG